MSNAHAQRVFSSAWFAANNAARSHATQTGKLPNGMPVSSLANPSAQQQRANEQLNRSINNLNIAARGIAAQQAAQAAARDAALKAGSDIPDGLADGGLKVDTNSLTAGWLNATAPTQTTASGETQVNIEQTAEKAILNWESFNVGRNTTVRFDQKGGAKADGTNDWIALNRINDPSGKPSQIAGRIKADGSVYIINRNGIIFNGSSQVNTRSLMAASLALSNKQFMAGINTTQYMMGADGFQTLDLRPQFGEYTDIAPYIIDTSIYDAAPWFTPSYTPGNVTVDAGAEIAAAPGGKLMLFAPKVHNAGTLSAPDGQVIMAAGENVWLSSIPANASPGSVPYWSSPVRGLEVAVSAVPVLALSYGNVLAAIGQERMYDSGVKYLTGLRDVVLPMMEARAAQVGYQVVNAGHVEAQRGDITLAGRDIVQQGTLLATSALNNREGSIRMQAWSQGLLGMTGGSLEYPTMMYWAAGDVAFRPGSVTSVMPDTTDKSQLELGALATRYRPGRIVVRGEFIDVQPDAMLMVPSGDISLHATSQPAGSLPDDPAGNDSSLRDGSRIYLDDRAVLSTAGLQDVAMAMESNLVTVDLRIGELRDSPLYRDSWLRGLKIVVDRRASGSFESGPMSGVTWLGDEHAGDWVGTPLADVSAWVALTKTDIGELSTKGGSIALKAGGSVIARAGSLLDVSGGSVTYRDGWIDTTRLLGADGRTYDIGRAMPDVAYIGLAGSYNLSHGRWGLTNIWKNPLLSRPRFESGYTEGRDAGSIAIFAGEAFVLEGDILAGTVAGERDNAPVSSSHGGRLVLGGPSNEDFAFSPGQVIVTDKPTRLAGDFDSRSVVPKDFYDFQDEYQLGKNTWLDAGMLGRSGLGELRFNVRDGFALEAGTTLELSPGAKVSVAPASLNIPVDVYIDGALRIAGGTFSTGIATHLGAGSSIDVSGQWTNLVQDGPGSVFAIDGGSILIDNLAEAAAGAVLDVSGGAYLNAIGAKPAVGDAGSIVLQNVADAQILGGIDLRAYAAGSGGSLTLNTSKAVQIGGAASDPAGTLQLPETLFADRGFSSVTIAGGGVTVADNAQVALTPLSVRLDGSFLGAASGQRLTDLGTLEVLRPEERIAHAPASLTLTGGDVLIGKGARLAVDTGGDIRLGVAGGGLLERAGTITILGTVDAPAGSIYADANDDVRLGDSGQLLARGVPIVYTDSRGLRTGSVLGGGTVELRSGGKLLLDAGGLIDVSGIQATIDAPGSASPWLLASDGGAISLTGNSLVASTLRARAGGPGALGGSLSIEVPSAGGGAGSPFDLIKNFLTAYAQANGDTSLTWRDVIGVDLSAFFGCGCGPFVFTQEFVNALAGLPNAADIVVVNKAPSGDGGAAGINPADWFPAGYLDELASYGLPEYDVRAILNSTVGGPAPSTVLASAINGGGFGNLALQTGATVKLDGVHLGVSRSISIGGGVANAGSADSSLTAPLVSFSGQEAPLAAASSSGVLDVNATLIDITGQTGARGFAQTRLSATDIRLSGFPATVGAPPVTAASFETDGHLVLHAGQVYPASGVQGTLKAADRITVEPNASAGLPLSAGGSLTLDAPVIEQNGVLRAPFGSITLKAGDRVELGAGSITSVSGDGLLLPYGQLVNAEFWTDPTQPQDTALIDMTALPEKRVTLEAPDVAVNKGALVDLRGGGDLQAWEFVAGLGGSHDILSMPGAFAVLPAHAAALSPGIDGRRIWLAGGNGLAAGWYTVLPAHYALLPGAFAVMPAGSGSYPTTFSTQTLGDGSTLMSGAIGDAFSGTQRAGYGGWRVMSGNTLRQYTEYNEALANDFFSSEAFRLTQYRRTGLDIATPRLAVDAGSLVLKASASLALRGELSMQAAPGGRGGLLDIAAGKIAIVGAGADSAGLSADGYLVLDANMLTAAGAGSLLIGGTRSGDVLGLRVDVTASDIVVQNDASSRLAGTEIILAARGDITLRQGSVIAAEGEATGAATDLVMKPQAAATWRDPDGWDDGDPKDDVIDQPARDWGALVRVSNAGDARVLRDAVDMSQGGRAILEEGVTLQGGKSLAIDATQATRMAASAVVSAESLTLGGGRIGFGGGTEGLVFDEQALAQLAGTDHLRLRSYSSIDFYRSIDFGRAGIGDITLDSAVLAGIDGGNTTLRAARLAFENTVGAQAAPASSGTGTLRIEAGEVVLGAGSKNIGGYSHVTVDADRIVGAGTGSLDAGAADVRLVSALLTGESGSSQSLRTTGLLELAGRPAAAGGADASADGGFGARIALSGSTVALDGSIVARGGAIDVTATSGDLLLGAGALIDVGGFAKTFFDVQEYVDAGRIGLTAVGGDVRMDKGASLNLAAHADGGNAGSLGVTASGGGSVVLDGSMAAHAGAGGRGGSFALDIAALPDFSGLGDRLNTAGFSASRQFRIRTGDVMVDGVTEVADFSLAADQGKVTIAGAIAAHAAYGGRISIAGGGGVTMESTARLVAGATDAELGSGRVTLEATGGRLDLRGGSIDASGGEGGVVRLRALQTSAHDDIAVDAVRVSITGARSAMLEGVSVYDAQDTVHASGFDGSTLDSVKADAAAHAASFAGNAAAIADRLSLDSGIAVQPGVEVRAQGDLTLGSDWNLHDDFAGAHEGTLTVRATGNLNLLGSISDGFDSAAPTGALLDSASWNLRLVAGADLSAANVSAMAPLVTLSADTGVLTVGASGAGTLVRTGTGDLEMHAGRDIVLADKHSAIYTAGRRDLSTFADFQAPADAVYGIGGGTVLVDAQGAIHAQPTDQRFTQWLKRVGRINPATGLYVDWRDEWGTPIDGAQPSWWVDHAEFMGVGALGGGNLALRAGGDLDNVVAVLPTQARLRGGLVAGDSKVLEMRNGGAFDIEAGGTILAGQYYLGRGAGTMAAGELAIGRTTTLVTETNGTHTFDVAPIIGLGDATLSVRAQGDLRLETVADPLMISLPGIWEPYEWGGGSYRDPGAYMSGYTTRSALKLVSVGGDVTLVNRAARGSADYIFSDIDETATQSSIRELISGLGVDLYPSLTHIAALNGSVVLDGPLFSITAPMAWTQHGYVSASAPDLPPVQSDFRLLAGENLVFATLQEFGMAMPEIVLSRATPELIPSVLGPRNDRTDNAGHNFDMQIRNDIASGTKIIGEEVRNPDRLPLAGDFDPARIYALEGSILGYASPSGMDSGNFTANQATLIRAGTDIRDVYYNLRNLRPEDVSIVAAGNDVIAGATYAGHQGIVIEGPGQLVVSAGRDIFAPAPDSVDAVPFTITSVGNQGYRYLINEPTQDTVINGLPATGASVTLMAGLGDREPDYAAFAAAYLDPGRVAAMPDYLKTKDGAQTAPIYLTDLVETRPGGVTKTVRFGLLSFMKEMTGETLGATEAWTRFQALPATARERFLREVFMQELRMAGRDQVTPDAAGDPLNGGYNRGHAAIGVLFPGDDWKGDIRLTDSGIRTMQGGDIDLIAPGGGVQLAALGRTPIDGRGVVTMGSGDIRAFVRDSLLVNRSRMLTFAGGDELVWATNGDIDAGRGAKTTRSFNRPVIETDTDGVTVLAERPDISGSGIGTVEGVPGVVADVDLVAPEGTVNAGDAGIRVAGNLTLAALYVLNADNIQVKGESKGLPAVAAVNIGALSNASAAASQATAAAQEAVQRERAATRQSLPSIFTVRVIGFGNEAPEGGGAAPATSPAGAAPRAARYDASSPVQLVGNGQNFDSRGWARLTSDERRQLRQDR